MDCYVDSFAGAGGASTGIRAAIERPVDIAINHSEAAIAMHAINHPETRHYCESIWEVDPGEACRGKNVRAVVLTTLGQMIEPIDSTLRVEIASVDRPEGGESEVVLTPLEALRLGRVLVAWGEARGGGRV